MKRFAGILLPTLTDAYTSTVNLNVRQKVLTAQLKMISNMDTDILKDALSGIQFASHLATILHQQDHPTLVLSAMDAAELLLCRVPDVYRYHFYREGVISEIEKLATKSPKSVRVSLAEDPSDESGDDDHMGSSPVSSGSSSSSRHEPSDVSELVIAMDSSLTLQAKKFMEVHEKEEATAMKSRANDIMRSLTTLSEGLKSEKQPAKLFEQLAGFFSSDALKSISSFELMNSGIVEALLSVLESTPGM